MRISGRKPLAVLIALWLMSGVFAAGPAKPEFTCGKNASFENGVYTLTSDGKEYTVCYKKIVFEKPEKRMLVFAAETRSEADDGKPDAHYSLMLNEAKYTDGTLTGYVAAAPCGSGVQDWKKVELRFTPEKPLQSVMLRLVYARRTGKVQFRNPAFELREPVAEPAAKPAGAAAAAAFDPRSIARSKLAEFGKRTSFVRNLYPDTPLVRHGEAVAALCGDPALAARINVAVKAKTGVELPLVPDTRYTGVHLDTHLIVIGNRNRNRTASALYSRYYAMADARYPGKGGYELRTVHNVFGDGHNVITVADGSDDRTAVDQLVAKIGKLPPGKDLTLPRLAEVKLDPEYVLPADIADLKGWNATDPASHHMGRGWNSFGRAMFMLYVTGERKYADLVMRFAFPDPATVAEMDRRDGETYKEMRQRPLVGIYHYGGISAMLWWDLVEESPVWTPAEREKLTGEFYQQLIHHLTASEFTPYRYHAEMGFDAKDRHSMWEMTLDYAAGRYFEKYYPGPESQEILRLCRNMEPGLYEHYMHPGITVTYHSSVLQPVLVYTLLRHGDGKIGNPMLVKLINSLGILLEDHRDETPWALADTSFQMLAQCAFLAQDEAYIRLAQRLGFGSGFRAGQSFIPARPYPNDFFRDTVNRWTVEPVQVDGPNREVEYLAWRGGDRDYLLLDTRYDGGRIAFHHLSLSNARVDGVPLLRGLDNALQFYPEGLNDLRQVNAAEIVRLADGAVTARVRGVNGFDWERTWRIEHGGLTVTDTVTPLRDMKFAEILNTFAAVSGAKWTRLDNGGFALEVRGRSYRLTGSVPGATTLESVRPLFGASPIAARFNLIFRDLKAGKPIAITTTLQPGKADGKPAADRIDAPAPRRVEKLAAPVGLLAAVPGGFAAASGSAIVLFSVDGRKRGEIKAGGTVTALTVYREVIYAGVLVGKGVEDIRAYSAAGQQLWSFRSKMPEELSQRGAPYWQKPAVPGIRALLVAEATPGRPLLYAGSAGAIEILDLAGKLVARTYVIYGPVDNLVFRPAKNGVPARVMILKSTGGWPRTYETDDQGKVSFTGMNRELDGQEMFYGFNAVGHTRLFPFEARGETVLAGDFNGMHNRLVLWSYDGKKIIRGVNLGAGIFMPWCCPPGLPATSAHFIKGMLPLGKNIGVAVSRKRFYRFDEDLAIKAFVILPAEPMVMVAEGDDALIGLANGEIVRVDPEGQMTASGALGSAVVSLLPLPGGFAAGCMNGTVAVFGR